MTDRCSQPVVSLRARPETHSDVYAPYDGGLTRSARVEDEERFRGGSPQEGPWCEGEKLPNR